MISINPMPPEFALTVGDAAQNLRSTLDHIVFAFATKPLSSQEERSIQFPLTSRKKNFIDRRDDWLPSIPQRVRALVERLQPYHRRKWPETKFLGQLQAINNWDKHRSMSITSTRVKRSTINIEGIAQQVNFHGRLKVGAVLTRFQLREGTVNTNVKVNGEIVVVPIFDKGMPKEVVNLSVVNWLRNVGRFIETSVIPQFEGLG